MSTAAAPAPGQTALRDWGLLLACNLIWASQFVMVKLVQEQMGPVFATFFPMAMATAFLAVIVRKGKRPDRADVRRFILLGVAGQVVAQLLITWGVRLSLASNAALISLALPVSTAVMARFILGERMTKLRWLSFGLAVLGVLFCSGVDWQQLNLTSGSYLLGNLLIFGSVNGSAFYNTYSKKLLTRYSDLEVLLYSYYAVIAFMAPIAVWSEPRSFAAIPTFSGTVWFGIAVLAVFQYFLSMVLFLKALTRLDATQAAVSNYLIPFFGVLIAAAVLGERMTVLMAAGGALVLLSTVLVTVYDQRRSG